MHQRLLPALVVVIASTLAFSGCSLLPGGGGGEEKLDASKSPLSEYFSAIYGDYDEKESIAQQKKVEELVASCMAEEGFDYTPVDQSQGMKFSSDDEDRDTEEWVAENGYGMNMTEEQEAEMNEQAEEWVDPNQPYVEALSESEQAAYYEVLYGPGPTAEEQAAMEAGESYEYNWENGGCQGAAQHEITGDDVTQSEKYKPLMDDISALYEKQQKSPEMVKLNSAWAACMADAGFADFKEKQDAIDEVSQAQNAFWENATPETTGPDAATKAEWRDHEIEVALADFTCAKKTDYEKKSLKAQFAMEDQFIADHKSELDALVADAEQAKK